VTEDPRILAGRYRIGPLIGRGGVAEVYRGVDTRLGRTVAIKLLRPALASDPRLRTRFRQEARAAARMAHPTIVRVYDAGEENVADATGVGYVIPFIIMEYVDGMPLSELIRRGPLAPAEAMRITDGILTALEYSHRAGVVHRDIKPGNVMIAKNGQVKVTDFGIARAVNETTGSLDKPSGVVGTANYFSPEQAKGDRVDARTDLYSTGVVLFEMVTGRPPFRGESAVSVAYQHVSELPVKASSINPRVSPALDIVIDKALQKDRYERYQTPAEFREDLRIVQSGRLPLARRSGPERSLPQQPGGAGQAAAQLRQLGTDRDPPRTQRRPPLLWIWGGVAVVVVAVIAALFWLLQQSPGNPLADVTRYVPVVAGLPLTDAEAQLRADDLLFTVTRQASDQVAKGNVISTLPAAGAQVPKNTNITIVVSSGPPPAILPDVTGDSLDQAQTDLRAKGFAIGTITHVDNPTVAAGQVVSTDPKAFANGVAGQTVDIVVSTGTVRLPNLRGQSVVDALKTLRSPALQLAAESVADPTCPLQKNTPVDRQSVAPGEVPQGTKVLLYFCTATSTPGG
jgi:serine/threonine-protein kinase